MANRRTLFAILLSLSLFVSAGSLLTVNADIQATISLSPQIRYQTIKGWEATAQAGQGMPGFTAYKDQLFDQTVNDLGINRLRVEIHTVSTTDASPDWTQLDANMDNVVLPLRQRLKAQGQALVINVCYVAFRDSTNLKADPQRYANYALAVFQHVKSKYGLTPDLLEIELEPDSIGAGQWTGTQVGNALVAAGNLLKANGFTPGFVAPSTTSMLHASQYIDQIMAVPGASSYVTEISYHRYSDVSLANLQAIAGRGQQYHLRTAMLERIGADFTTLHQDLKVGKNSAWQQYTLAFPTSDNGAQYYWIDNSNPSQPVVHMGSRTKLLRQYFKFIHAGAVRIDAATTNTGFDPVAFINPDGKYVVVVNASSGGSFSIVSLPPGIYGIKYTTTTTYDVNSPDVTIGPGQTLTASIPGAGAITIYGKSSVNPSPTPAATTTVTPTPAIPQPVALQSPSNASTLYVKRAGLSWTASDGATYYRFQVRQSSTVGTLVAYGQTALTSYLTPYLAANYQYYWRARACNSGGCSGWSAYWSFSIKTPDQPIQLSPADGAIVSNSPELDWTNSTGATYYTIRARQGSTSGPLVVATSTTNSYYSLNTLDPGYAYYWRVAACSAAGCSKGTGWWQFNIP